MNKNLLQNACIFVLIFTSLILLSIRFELLFFLNTSSANVLADKVDIEYSVRPNSIVLRIGKENTKKIFDNNGVYYRDVAKVLKSSISAMSSMNEISHSRYKDKKTIKGIQLNFSPEINQRLLYGSLFLKEGSIGEIKNISEIIIPQTYDKSIYINADGKYYEMKNNESNVVLNFDEFANLSVSRYYSLNERFPEFTDNDVLIAEELRLNTMNSEPMFNEKNIDVLGRAILGNKYDFANMLGQTDGYSIIDYDYGREIIEVMPDGKVTYTKNTQGNISRTHEMDAGNIAMNFVYQITRDKAIITLESVRRVVVEDKFMYEVNLSQRIDGIRISDMENKSTIKVIVSNNEVVSMEGLFRNLSKSAEENMSLGENAILFILDKNYEYIKNKEPFASTEDLFSKIKFAEYSYVYDGKGNIVACYKIIIGDSIFLFKIKDGEVML